jgi:hypothetical protein
MVAYRIGWGMGEYNWSHWYVDGINHDFVRDVRQVYHHAQSVHLFHHGLQRSSAETVCETWSLVQIRAKGSQVPYNDILQRTFTRVARKRNCSWTRRQYKDLTKCAICRPSDTESSFVWVSLKCPELLPWPPSCKIHYITRALKIRIFNPQSHQLCFQLLLDERLCPILALCLLKYRFKVCTLWSNQ